ncbi:MAG: hypothetical protein QY311_02980 [Candidatus Paceibacterota bacterium]|nr:MAG: hypothetical protein QY311_02980 [Candidatus Paceibacterota bacterium]
MNQKKRATASLAELVAEVSGWRFVVGMAAVIGSLFIFVCMFRAGVAWEQGRLVAAVALAAASLVAVILFLVILTIATRNLRGDVREFARRMGAGMGDDAGLKI